MNPEYPEQPQEKPPFQLSAEEQKIFDELGGIILNRVEEDPSSWFRMQEKAKELQKKHPDYNYCLLYHKLIGSTFPEELLGNAFFDFPGHEVERFVREEIDKE